MSSAPDITEAVATLLANPRITVSREKAYEHILDRRPVPAGETDEVLGSWFGYAVSEINMKMSSAVAAAVRHQKAGLFLGDTGRTADYEEFNRRAEVIYKKHGKKVGSDLTWVGQAMDLSSVLDKPASRSMIVDRFIEEERAQLVFGRPGGLKTNLLLDAGIHVASGLEWCGLEVEQAPVVFIQQDMGARDTRERMHAFMNGGDIKPPIPFFMYTFPNPQLDLRHNPDPLFDAIQRHEAKLAIVDNLFNSAGVRDENSSEIGLAIRTLAEIRDATGASIVVIHHPTKAAGWSRGHGSIVANLDTSVKVLRILDFVRFEAEKERAGPVLDNVVFKFNYKWYPDSTQMKFARFTRASREEMALASIADLMAEVLMRVASEPGIGKTALYEDMEQRTGSAAAAVKQAIDIGWLKIDKDGKKHCLYITEDGQGELDANEEWTGSSGTTKESTGG